MRSAERNDEEVWKGGYCSILPVRSLWDSPNIITVIPQLYIIEDGECANFF
jgi:hypothetical protein